MIFTFWEGRFPDYIKLCLDTWRLPFTILNYGNLQQYTDLSPEKLGRFTLPQVADCVRVHVLRDNGGYWLDADTIMLSKELPAFNMMGYPDLRNACIGMLSTEAHSDMFEKWASYQDEVINNPTIYNRWDVVGNAFTDGYIKAHPEITIGEIRKCWPETYMIDKSVSRMDKYKEFYFGKQYHLSDLEKTNLLILHNSWTPDWYKELTVEEVLTHSCTMSNVLREAL